MFKLELVAIADVDIITNHEYATPFFEMVFKFDDGSDIKYAINETDSVRSEIKFIESMFHICGRETASEMKGAKLYMLKQKDTHGNFETVGFGQIYGGHFFHAFDDGELISLTELKHLCTKCPYL